MSSDNETRPLSDTISPEERIRELNEVDRDISQVLNIASKAIGLLPNEKYDTPNPRLKDVKADFEGYVHEYYNILSSISVRLRRQVYGLEEAGLITKGTRYDADRAASMNENQSSRREGGGPLDSSWLNARAKDSTGQGLRQEILEEAKEFLTKNNNGMQEIEREETMMDTTSG